MSFTTQNLLRVALQLNTAREGGVPLSEPSVYVDDFIIDMYVAPNVDGDFNNDSVVNSTDIDLLCDAIDGGGDPNVYDVNGDTFVDSADVIQLVEGVLETEFGDSDTDGDVDLSDLGNLATNYEQAHRRMGTGISIVITMWT